MENFLFDFYSLFSVYLLNLLLSPCSVFLGNLPVDAVLELNTLLNCREKLPHAVSV